ncbi:hypothetical protein F4813DRAFT_341545 [Daldinia decipiens]|uniref:uncharacterized protein n=1 Tax=Daldinia decipiens TaxID=326647 RepID=UPI0020C23C02|nr:uncharacterized protein F4813DRAFT_341545 [Daldinia decipiens]KAI1662682.1 hypothetical protein F4813DRAFT_341545 [Daldinia decipiens]
MPTLSAQLRCAAAINDVLDGASLRQASKKHLISRHYLTDRILGRRTRDDYLEERQKLSKYQEKELADWAVTLSRIGHAPPLYRFRDIARRLLAHNHRPDTLGPV